MKSLTPSPSPIYEHLISTSTRHVYGITNTKHVHRRIRSDDWAASSPGAKARFTVLDPLRWMSEVPFYDRCNVRFSAQTASFEINVSASVQCGIQLRWIKLSFPGLVSSRWEYLEGATCRSNFQHHNCCDQMLKFGLKFADRFFFRRRRRVRHARTIIWSNGLFCSSWSLGYYVRYGRCT